MAQRNCTPDPFKEWRDEKQKVAEMAESPAPTLTVLTSEFLLLGRNIDSQTGNVYNQMLVLARGDLDRIIDIANSISRHQSHTLEGIQLRRRYYVKGLAEVYKYTEARSLDLSVSSVMLVQRVELDWVASVDEKMQFCLEHFKQDVGAALNRLESGEFKL